VTSSRARLVLAALVLVALGVGVALGLLRDRSPSLTKPPPAAAAPGGAAAAQAFERFAARCLETRRSVACWREAGMFLGKLDAVQQRSTAKARRLELLCAKSLPPPSCARKDETLADLRTLESTLVAYAGQVRAKYPNARSTALSGAGLGPPAGQQTTLTGSVEQTDRTWVCNRPVRLDSVTVTITPDAPRHQGVGIRLDAGCTGTIQAIHVASAVSDGVDVHDARDLTINGGSIVCNGRAEEAHQDGIQAMAGSNVVFRRVTVDCPTASNAGFYVNAIPGRPSMPERILFLDGRIGPTQSSTVFVARHQTGSGVANSVLCRSRYFNFRNGGSGEVVNRGNTFRKDC
jgi:hypothetical protein